MILNEVHRLIESKKIIFLLTGSSARKLKRKDINLLAGRAWKAELFSLVSAEILDFDLNRYLIYGGLPAVYNSNYPSEELFAYVETYLKEEIQAEALVRKIPAFSRFLQVSALTNGQMINFTNISQDTGIPVSTVKQYYQILEDTLIVFFLCAWTKSIKRKAVTVLKFYYFDTGVCNTIAGIKYLDINSDLYARSFEHFIILELKAYLSYRRIHVAF
jgi:predicted AAA+ superfamily ATPase